MVKKSKLLQELGEKINENKTNIDVNEIPLVFLEELTNEI